MRKNIIAKNLGKVMIDEIHTHNNANPNKGPDGLNIVGHFYTSGDVGIGTDYVNNSSLKILGNTTIVGKDNNYKLLTILNNNNQELFEINNNENIVNIDKIINKNLYIKNGIKVPTYSNNLNLLNENGSIIYNNISHRFEGYTNNKWKILGGINPEEDIIIKNNLSIIGGLQIPIYNNQNNIILNKNGSIIYNQISKLYEGYNNDRWESLGGINPYEDIYIKNNLVIDKNVNIKNSLYVSNSIIGNLNGISNIAYNLASTLNIFKGGTGLDYLGNSGQILQVKEDLSGLTWSDVTITTPVKTSQLLKKLSGLYDNRIIESYILIKPSIEILNNNYIWKLIDNYKILGNITKQLVITINFSLYDTNLNTHLKFELYIDSEKIENQTIEEKIFSANQYKNINKIFILNLNNDYKDIEWNIERNINLKIIDVNNSGNIKIFTYNGNTLNHPKIIIDEIGESDGSIGLRQNLVIEKGSINDTIIGDLEPTSASFTNINLKNGDLINSNNINCDQILTNSDNGLKINFMGSNNKNIINIKNNLDNGLEIVDSDNNEIMKIKTKINDKQIYFYNGIEATDLILKGNFTVNGNTNIISSTNTLIKDNIIGLNDGIINPINDSGILINRGSEQNSFIGWDETKDKFIMGLTNSDSLSSGNLDITKSVLISDIEGNITGNLNGNALTANHSLTCDTATQLHDVLSIYRGGTGLDILGTEGQILQVKNDLSGLEWRTPTAIVAPKIYRVLEKISALYDNRVIKGYTFLNPTIQILNNYYEWNLINYEPINNTKQIIFKVDFSIFDTNLNTNLKFEYFVDSEKIINQTIEEKIFSANQQKNMQKTLIINLEGIYKDLDWIGNKTVKLRITDLNHSNNIKLFTYNGFHINYPKIYIESIGIDDGNLSLQTNLIVENGSINNTIIGDNNPTTASFTNINMTNGNINDINTVNSINLITTNITTSNPLSIENGGTGLNYIGQSGQVLYVNSQENGLEWKMIPQRSLQSNQILENLVGIYDNRLIKTYLLQNPNIQLLNNTYEWICINDYLPPDNTKEIVFNFDFNIYDSNLNSIIKFEYIIDNITIHNQTVEEKIFSANQQKNITKKLIINIDGSNKDLEWITPKNIILKITDLYNTNKIKLFTYNGYSISYPKISIQAIGNNLGDISINQNLTINEGVINNTIIGETIPNKAYFTNLYVSDNLVHFTGAHLNNFDFDFNESKVGYIVVSSGNFKNKPSINKSLPIVSLSNTNKQKNVYGVISGLHKSNELYINALGEGAIWITNTNGNLKNGDYIQTSNILGLGEKQNSETLCNYTVAKILHDCDFNINNSLYKSIEYYDTNTQQNYIKCFVGCTYHCG